MLPFGTALAEHTFGGYYRVSSKLVGVVIQMASAARRVRSMTRGRLYSCDALLERLAQDLEDLAAELGQFIQEEHPVVGPRHLARQRHLAPADQPCVRDGAVDARNGRVVTKVVRSPVRPATLWMRVVSQRFSLVLNTGEE
jgi:hypothetical protein